MKVVKLTMFFCLLLMTVAPLVKTGINNSNTSSFSVFVYQVKDGKQVSINQARVFIDSKHVGNTNHNGLLTCKNLYLLDKVAIKVMLSGYCQLSNPQYIDFNNIEGETVMVELRPEKTG